MADCHEKSAIGHNQREENKERIERQNFTIKPQMPLANSDTKNIGDHQGRGINNLIDQDDLKASHVPFDGSKNKDKLYSSFYGSTNKTIAATKNAKDMGTVKQQYSNLKTLGERSKLPFSPQKRNRVERDYNKFDSVNGYSKSTSSATYQWKVPKYDLK